MVEGAAHHVAMTALFERAAHHRPTAGGGSGCVFIPVVGRDAHIAPGGLRAGRPTAFDDGGIQKSAQRNKTNFKFAVVAVVTQCFQGFAGFLPSYFPVVSVAAVGFPSYF